MEISSPLAHRPADIVEPVIVTREVLEIAADPRVRSKGRSVFSTRELAQVADQRALWSWVSRSGGGVRIRPSSAALR